jgi:hypothetical protein
LFVSAQLWCRKETLYTKEVKATSTGFATCLFSHHKKFMPINFKPDDRKWKLGALENHSTTALISTQHRHVTTSLPSLTVGILSLFTVTVAFLCHQSFLVPWLLSWIFE